MHLSCGHESDPSPANGCGAAGYATLATGEKICYACAAELTRADMRRDGKVILYLTGRTAPAVTTWDGTVISANVRVLRRWKDNFGGDRISFRFRFDDEVWSGSGPGYGMYCRARRTQLPSLYA